MGYYKTILLSLGLSSFLLSGCASNNEALSTNITTIEKSKREQLKDKINVGVSGSQNFKAYVDSDDYRLKYLCYNNNEKLCNYYDAKKHSYTNGAVDEEQFYIYPSGYAPLFSPSTRNVQCGTGSLAGWLAVFMVEPFGMADHNKKNPMVCYSNFTKVDSTQMGVRFVWGMLTFMTPFVTAGNMHTQMFDAQSFKEAIYISNIESFKTQLFELSTKYNLEGGFDVIYLEQGDIKENLEDKYSELLTSEVKKAGVIFLEKQSNRLLSINVFNKYKNEHLMKAISLQIEDLLENIEKNNRYVLKYEDILPFIPAEITPPAIPAVPKLVKSEYEKQREFEAKVKKAVEERESEIRNLQRKYSQDVEERNSYIDNLQKAYEQYLEQTSTKKNRLLSELKKSLPVVSKVLFLENTSGYGAKEFKYDAEREKLYFNIYSHNKDFNQEVVASVQANMARKIKENKSFKIIPKITATASAIELSGFDILETSSNQSFETQYTNINFKPQIVSVVVKGTKESITKDVSNKFKKYKQKDQTIVDTSTKEMWYIQVAKTVNAQVPKWFSNPISNGAIIGYGEAETLEEAKVNARNDLAYMVSAKINTVYEKNRSIDEFKSFKEIKKQTKQTSEVELTSSDYKIYKQDNADGRWYVGFVYAR